jgi:DNA-directed RNA polymerase III subunit RPC1
MHLQSKLKNSFKKNKIYQICVVLKTCGQILLTPEDKIRFLEKFKRRAKDSNARNKIFKQVIAECKKKKKCLQANCRADNGVVKKKPGEATKIIFLKKKFNPSFKIHLYLI